MQDKLKDYANGIIHYTPIMNLLMNNRSVDWYVELGKYITETLDIEKIPELSFLSDRLKQKKNVLTKIKDFLSEDGRLYFSVSSFFLTSALNEKSLENMFGKPLLHSLFGEGFDGEWNEELDDYDEPKIKEFYASYFVNVSGANFHIGYDHRGTGIEIEVPTKFGYEGSSSDKDAEKCFESVKKLIDLYKEKIR